MGETQLVNRHGALISAPVTFHVGREIEIYVILTDKRATGTLVYIDPDRPQPCGIALKEPQNMWGISPPPDDWKVAKIEQ